MLDESLKRVSVLGAAGKMGSGISLLLLQEMARREAMYTGGVGNGEYSLVLIDANKAALGSLRRYLRSQVRRFAEKNINPLREFYAENRVLISNEEIIDAFVEGAIDMVRFETEVEQAKESLLIFEAILEDVEVKTEVFAKINSVGRDDAYYFTNTSSIPIGVLSKKSGLGGRLIGYHFFNPPPVQRLLEIIPAEETNKQLIEDATLLAEIFRKVVVTSKDVAGFIGNGHFIREIDYAFRKVRELEKEYSRPEAILMIDRVTRDFLLRPMGVFQLIDYVGIDVCQEVINIMTHYLGVSFERSLIDQMVHERVLGGQNPDGSQKEGFFQYEKRKPVKIYSEGAYTDFPKIALDDLPKGHIPWKQLHKMKDREVVLRNYFHDLFAMDTLGAQLAQGHLYESREIARNLVKEGVAETVEEVNLVLRNGFYHLYGADNPWIPEKTSMRAGP
ncbi:MAG: putative 3-hydroxybutyryl-CoA dehydrogenase [Chlamydiae bacterium]|nr:putative 3-hydroxybutyryl-CoA dehydrogenase [Chlamydiota bacterium]